MSNKKEVWQSPLVSRYTSLTMQRLFSDDVKFSTWRKLWVAQAKAQKLLGLPITNEQIAELEEHINDIDYDKVAEIERANRHDVMAHIKAYGLKCPQAAKIIHLGATSCFVTDNTDLILMRDGLDIIIAKLAVVIDRFTKFSNDYKSLPCLGYTHLIAAQPVTVGKRAAMWLVDLLMDLENLITVRNRLKFLGSKGATGTQASFLTLFNGDASKVKEMNRLIAKEFGFNEFYPITGQTYSRKVDSIILGALAGLAESVHKIAFDLRELQAKKEIEEPFKKDQDGSSAMPYKRNPMTLERACSLARHLIALNIEPEMTHMIQLFERTLDDSAGRRIYIPEAFLTAEALLMIMQFIGEGLVVYPKMIERHLKEELPFMASEEIIMAMVTVGGDRQECHNQLKILSQEAGNNVKFEGGENDLIARLKKSEYFKPIHDTLDVILNPEKFVVGVPEMVDEFLSQDVYPAIEQFGEDLSGKMELKV